MSGTFAASGQSATVMVSPDITNLAPGTYNAQLTISANDISNIPALGSPQTIAVSLTVQQACTLQATPTTIAFSAVQGQSSSTSQSVSMSESGNCARPVSWTASDDSNSTNWLLLSATSGTDNGSGSTFTIGYNVAALTAGTYKGTVTLSASGSGSAMITNSPLTISVTFTVTSLTVKGTVYACANQACATPKALAGAKISVTNSSGAVVGSFTANSLGAYKLSGLGIGSYTLTVTGSDASGTNYSNTVSVTVSNSLTGFNINTYPPNVTPSPTS